MLPAEKDPLAPGESVKPNKVEPARKTWFFQRATGEIFGTKEVEAGQLLRQDNVLTRSLRLVGCSDGTTFQKAVAESQRIFNETKDLAEAQKVLRQGELDEIEKARGNMEQPRDLSGVITKKSA